MKIIDVIAKYQTEVLDNGEAPIPPQIKYLCLLAFTCGLEAGLGCPEKNHEQREALLLEAKALRQGMCIAGSKGVFVTDIRNVSLTQIPNPGPDAR